VAIEHGIKQVIRSLRSHQDDILRLLRPHHDMAGVGGFLRL